MIARLATTILALLLGWGLAGHGPGPGAAQPHIRDSAARTDARFGWVDIYLDSGDSALAAWQVELHAITGDAALVGIEGGDHPAFAEPPYYDPEALQSGERVVLASFDTARHVPTGRTRVARVHVRTRGEVVWQVRVQAAAASDGRRLDPEVTIKEGSAG